MKKFNSVNRAAKHATEAAIVLLKNDLFADDVKAALNAKDERTVLARLLNLADETVFTLSGRLSAALGIKPHQRAFTQYKAHRIDGRRISSVRRPTSAAERRKLKRAPRPTFLYVV